MLLSQKDERRRRITLAFRAGIPVLTLLFLVFITTIYKGEESLNFNLKDAILLIAITFTTTYFIYFIMNLSIKETILDQTTQGFNKKAFIRKLQEDHPTTLGCLTIQNLQTLNENYSSDQIDNLLYSITRTLNLTFKQNGLNNLIIGRGRGSEFLIALNDKSQNTHAILKKMTGENAYLNEMEIEYGFAVIKNPNNEFEKMLLQLRDMISSQSVNIDESENEKDAKDLSQVEQCVISAIQNKQLKLSFRPLFNTNSNIIDTYEIAVKLSSSNFQDILPRVFLPIVNRLGLGRAYDLMLVEHVIILLPLVDNNISFTFNLSPFSLRDKTFQINMFDLIKQNTVDPSRLIIQLYERKTHHDLSGYLKTLKSFRAQGLRICIDNFGSSNASMEYIKHFKFDMVQFDRDYVTNLEDKTTHAMLHSLIKMSKDLEVKTVAKWVDNEKQKNKLHLLGIDYVQGFGVSKPINETTLIDQYN